MFQIDPIVQAGNEGVVHHMILYECRDNFPQIHVDFEGTTTPSATMYWTLDNNSLGDWRSGGYVSKCCNDTFATLSLWSNMSVEK